MCFCCVISCVTELRRVSCNSLFHFLVAPPPAPRMFLQAEKAFVLLPWPVVLIIALISSILFLELVFRLQTNIMLAIGRITKKNPKKTHRKATNTATTTATTASAAEPLSAATRGKNQNQRQ